jgi:hypothetical protein
MAGPPLHKTMLNHSPMLYINYLHLKDYVPYTFLCLLGGKVFPFLLVVRHGKHIAIFFFNMTDKMFRAYSP